MDVTCSLDLTVGDLGVVALRLVKRSGEVGVADLGDLVDQFEPAVVDMERVPEISDEGLRVSTFRLPDEESTGNGWS